MSWLITIMCTCKPCTNIAYLCPIIAFTNTHKPFKILKWNCCKWYSYKKKHISLHCVFTNKSWCNDILASNWIVFKVDFSPSNIIYLEHSNWHWLKMLVSFLFFSMFININMVKNILGNKFLFFMVLPYVQNIQHTYVKIKWTIKFTKHIMLWIIVGYAYNCYTMNNIAEHKFILVIPQFMN